MTNIPKCTHWRGHKFEARYSVGEPMHYDHLKGSAYAIERFLEASKPQTYERDICVRCGHIIDRVKP